MVQLFCTVKLKGAFALCRWCRNNLSHSTSRRGRGCHWHIILWYSNGGD